MKNSLKKYVGPDGNIIKPIPAELFQTKEAARDVLVQIDGIICPKIKEEPKTKHLGAWRDNATIVLSNALYEDCLAGDEIAEILNRKIDYRKIYEAAFFRCDQQTAESEDVLACQAQYIDILLFILELYQPHTDRLRKERVKYEMARILKINKGNHNASPQQFVASWGWEKKIRNSKRFKALSKLVLEHMRDEYGTKAPYWIFTLATRCHDVDYNFFAFDSSYHYLPTLSDQIAGDMQKSGEIEVQCNYRPNYLYDLCLEYNLEMVGTPFMSPLLNDELHIYAQQISISQRQNAIEARIPAFYTLNHLTTLLEKDFGDLKKALTGDTFLKRISDVRMPDVNTCPLSDAEMIAVAKVILKVLKHCYQMFPYKSYRCADKALSYWWNYNEDKPGSRLERGIKPPSFKGGKDLSPIPSRDNIVKMVAQKINKALLTSKEIYAWHMFQRAVSAATGKKVAK